MRKKAARLDAVLALRTRELDAARRTLAIALGESIRLEGERERWSSEALRAAEALSTRLSNGANAFDVRASAGAVDKVRERATSAAEQLTGCERAITAARREVVAAKTRARALEVVQERREDAERSLIARAAQLQLDEVGTRTAIEQGER